MEKKKNHIFIKRDEHGTFHGGGRGPRPGPVQVLTFEARYLLALGLAEERQLVGDGFQHLHEVGKEEDDLDIMVS